MLSSRQESQYWNSSTMMGNTWANFFILIGARGRGKSYRIIDMYLGNYKRNGNPFIWLRLSETSVKNLTANNCQSAIDPDLLRKHCIEDVYYKNRCLYEVTKRGNPGSDGTPGKVLEKKLICEFGALATFYNLKGVGIYDKDWLINHPGWRYNIILDEMNRESCEKNSFDIPKAFKEWLETRIRKTEKVTKDHTTQDVRCFMIGNDTIECSDLCALFGFVPNQPGVYKLRRKNCIIEYLDNSEAYKRSVEKSVVGVLSSGEEDLSYNTRKKPSNANVFRGRPKAPSYIIKFNGEKLFTVWDGRYILPYKNEKVPVWAMRRHLPENYVDINVKNTIKQYDLNYFKYNTALTEKLFRHEMELLKPATR